MLLSNVRSAQEHAVVIANDLLTEAQEDYRAELGNADDHEDRKDHDEDRAERKTKLALVAPNVLK